MAEGFFKRLGAVWGRVRRRVSHVMDYATTGVWCDTRRNWKINVLKTLNLSIRSFLNGDIQSKACAMTFRTLLAVVPALALIFAIGRGFGLQDVLQNELITEFSSQRDMLERVFSWVDYYLDQSSNGLFVGVGIVLLLWTLISLLSATENSFNQIWGVKEGRSLWRKASDYLAIFLILPVLMICASGITVFVSSTVENALPFEFMTPLLSMMLDVASLVLIWLFFTGVYMMIPNARVKFKNAFMAGVLAGTAFLVLQWLFISGTLYVSKYNAIYGSFAFFPLFLIWLQLAWVICLSGGVICFASQNIFRYNFSSETASISLNYRSKIIVSIMVVVVDNYERQCVPITENEISSNYGLPPGLVGKAVNSLIDAGLLLRTVNNPKAQVFGLAPAIDPSVLTIGEVLCRVRRSGTTEFVPGFEHRFSEVISKMDDVEEAMMNEASRILIRDISVAEIDRQSDINK